MDRPVLCEAKLSDPVYEAVAALDPTLAEPEAAPTLVALVMGAHDTTDRASAFAARARLASPVGLKQKTDIMMKGTPLAVLAVILTLTGCGGTPSRTVRLGEQTIDLGSLTAAEVARETSVITRGEDTIYRAPTLSSYRDVELGRGGPTLGANMGTVKVGRQGFLFGVSRGRQPVASYVAFQSNLVEGTGRYVAVTLGDGTPLSIRTTNSNQARCEPDCLLVFETVVVEVPDAVLRATPGEGLLLDYRLDNGTVTRATVPAAYVRGYLQAVAAAR